MSARLGIVGSKLWPRTRTAAWAVICATLSSVGFAKPTTQFDSEITTTYPFNGSTTPAPNAAAASKTKPVDKPKPRYKPPSHAADSKPKSPATATPSRSGPTSTKSSANLGQGQVGAPRWQEFHAGPVVEDPTLRAEAPNALQPSVRASNAGPTGTPPAPVSVPLVRVPWADAPMTLAAAQRDLSWRATLPSSGIAAWGINPVQNPERSLVEVMVGGGVVGVGVVLEGGTVLTSLTVIGRGLEIQVRFADGSTEAASVRRTHRAYDLALLEPQGSRVRTGLPLARQVHDSVGLLFWGREVSNRGPIPVDKAAGKPVTHRGMVRPVPLEWYGAGWGADGVPLHAALKPPQLTELGTPMVNASGHLAALVTLACVVEEARPSVDSRGCRVTRVGLTSGTLGEFLDMVERNSAHVWFGVIGETTDTGWARGVRITALASGSPAAAAGLRAASGRKPGDIIVAIDDTPVYDPTQLQSALRAQHAGSNPVLTVLRDGHLQQILVTLPSGERPLPLAETPEPWVSF